MAGGQVAHGWRPGGSWLGARWIMAGGQVAHGITRHNVKQNLEQPFGGVLACITKEWILKLVLDKKTKEFYSLLENNRGEGWEDFSFSDREIVCCPCSREAMLTGGVGGGVREGGGGDMSPRSDKESGNIPHSAHCSQFLQGNKKIFTSAIRTVF